MNELLASNLHELGSNADMKAWFSVFGTCVAAVFGGDLTLLNALIALWALDFILGFKRAWDCESISRLKFRNGLFKIVLYVITIAVMGLAEYSMGTVGTYFSLRNLTISYLCITEAMSCLEHLSFFGVPIPESVRKRLKAYRDCLHDGTLPQGESK